MADLAFPKPFSATLKRRLGLPRAPLFSIVVPTRNRPALLKTALEAIKRQTFTDYEVLVVDDGSTVECRFQYAALWAQLDERFRLLRLSPDGSPGNGPSEVRNHAITVARGQFLAFCDDDDYWCAEDHLNVAAQALAQVPEADVYYANQIAYRGEKLISADRWPQLRGATAEAHRVANLDVYRLRHAALLKLGGIAHLNISIVRLKLVREIAGFWQHLRYEEDFDFYLRSLDRARVALYRPTVVARHNAPNLERRESASTLLNPTERLLSQCMACEHVRLSARTPAVLELSNMIEGYAMRRLTLQLRKNNQHQAAMIAARQALAILPGWRWSGFVTLLRLRQTFARLIPARAALKGSYTTGKM